MAAFPPSGQRFTEDFSSLHQYQPAANMDPETGALTTDYNTLQDTNTNTNAENLSPQAPNPNTIIPQQSNTVTSRTSRVSQDHYLQAEETPQRSGTLKKKNSVKRSGSRKSKAGSIRSVKMEQQEQIDVNSVFYTPVPTNSSPTDLLVNRFQAWRKVLKDFITYFREVQAQYESRARGIAKVTQSLHTTSSTSDFAPHGGILEVNNVLRDFHKEATINSEHAAKIERDIINNLNGLRSDLNLKLKEIKALSPDFKNNVEKEKEATKREIQKLQEAIKAFEENQSAGGKDPYVLKLAVERQLRRQLQEENYLHRAYLNIESSGRELEKLIVIEIQKCYSVYISILSRDGQELLDLSSRLTTTTLQLPPDYEWSHFISRSSAGGTGGLVDPSIPLRSLSSITYPGYQHPLLTEVRSGMLERKSKYLKSFTPAWYVLSPTYLHEFKSPDRVRDPNPVMSLYLPESSLGKYSDPAAVSHKFALKAKQPGSLHRGHNWVFRAETHEMMLEWYEAIKKLIEVKGKEREEYVATNNTRMRSLSGAGSVDSQEELQDEEDEQPYSAQASDLAPVEEIEEEKQRPKRPEGGRFPSDIMINRVIDNHNRHSTSSDSTDAEVASSGVLPSAAAVHEEGQVDRDEGFRDGFGNADSHHMDQSYVIIPNEQRRDSWSPVEHPDYDNRQDTMIYGQSAKNTSDRDTAVYTHPTYVSVRDYAYDQQPQAAQQSSYPPTGAAGYQHPGNNRTIPPGGETGYGIDPITGVPEREVHTNLRNTHHESRQIPAAIPIVSGLPHSPPQSPRSPRNSVFLESEEVVARASPEVSDVREPIPPAEVDQVVLDSVGMDEVVERNSIDGRAMGSGMAGDNIMGAGASVGGGYNPHGSGGYGYGGAITGHSGQSEKMTQTSPQLLSLAGLPVPPSQSSIGGLGAGAPRGFDRPAQDRSESMETVGKGTIRDLHIPGDYPRAGRV